MASREMIERLQDFAKWAIRESAFAAADLDGLSVQEKAVELGLLEETTYDPEKHGPSDCAPGMEWFVFSAALDAALTPSEGVGGANIRPVQQRCKAARRARELLQAAHDACFKALDRDILGMSSGPFSGVNEVLGLIAEMDSTLAAQAAQITSLSAKVAAVEGERDEALRGPWPKWADEIRKHLESYGVDPGDEWDLPEQFGMWVAGVVEAETARAEAAEARADRLERQNRQMVEAIRDALGRHQISHIHAGLRDALTKTEGKADV